MIKPVEIKTLDNYTLWLKFSDGAEGTVALSYLTGKGVFKAFENPNFFSKAHIAYGGSAIAWNDELDIDALNLYLKITGKTFEKIEPLN